MKIHKHAFENRRDLFGKRHEENAQANEDIKIALAEIKSDLKLFLEFMRDR